MCPSHYKFAKVLHGQNYLIDLDRVQRVLCECGLQCENASSSQQN